MKNKLYNLIVPLILLGWLSAAPSINCIFFDINEAAPVEASESTESNEKSEDLKALNHICKRRISQYYKSFIFAKQSSKKVRHNFISSITHFPNSFHSQLIPLRV
jgi:hypothetical protein